jgi:glutathione peroxidase
MNVYDMTVTDINGNTVALSEFKGKSALIVNVASQCGFTPQYGPLQELYELHKDKFVVLGFPCNQFGNQEPGTHDEIKAFCESKYGVNFPMFAKVDVKGENQDSLYRYLTEKTGEEPQWNFHKYFVNSNGDVIASFGTKTDPYNEKILELITQSD